MVKDPDFDSKLETFITAGKPVLVTDGLAGQIGNLDQYENVQVLQVDGKPRNILRLSREEVNSMRNKLLEPFGIKFNAPTMVSLYLMGEDLIIIENFKDEAVNVTLETEFSMNPEIKLTLPMDQHIGGELTANKLSALELPPRTLIAVSY
jgi:hypothetical protein